MELVEVITLLEQTVYATIATADSRGNPWNSPVFFAYDNQLTLYWSSHAESIHSKNILASHKAFIVIYDTSAREGDGQGLYIDAEVDKVTDEVEIAQALKLLGLRRGRPFLHPEKFSQGGQQQLYKAMPKMIWTNDAKKDSEGDFIQDYRVSLDLDRITMLLRADYGSND